jgi:hypothetical protein
VAIPVKKLESTLPAVIGAAVLLVSGSALAENLRFRCANVANGASWAMAVDVDHRRVDNVAADIDARSITWRDPENRTYELDRATGALRMSNASSTGGYYLYYTCRPE